MSIKVLCLSRRDILKRRGGDTVQIENTMRYLNKLYDVKFKIAESIDNENLGDYDIVHLFGIVRVDEVYNYHKYAKEYNKKIVVSPVYWNFDEYNQKGRYGYLKFLYKIINEDKIEFLKGLIRNQADSKVKIDQSISLYEKRRYVLKNSSIILPNSKIEMDKMIEEFKLTEEEDYVVVNNAIDSFFLNKQLTKEEVSELRQSLFGEDKPYVICVARFDPRKNHLRLIEAIKKIKLPLLLVGNKIDTQKYYNKLIDKHINGNKNIKVVNYQSQEELYKYYQAASVHALPSWAETPGLVNIEAAASGCKLVVSDRGSEKEYFGELASYCNPEDVNSILKAIEFEYFNRDSYVEQELKNKIMSQYLWEHTANSTYEAYKSLL